MDVPGITLRETVTWRFKGDDVVMEHKEGRYNSISSRTTADEKGHENGG